MAFQRSRNESTQTSRWPASSSAEARSRDRDDPVASVLRHPRVWRDALLRRLLALADLFAVVAAAISLDLNNGKVPEMTGAAFLAPVWLVVAKVSGLYDQDQRVLRHLTADEAPKIFVWGVAGTGATALLLHAGWPSASLGSGQALWLFGVAVVAALVLRGLARAVWRRVTPGERTVIVGNGPLADAARRKIALFSDIHVSLVEAPQCEPASDLLGALEHLVEIDRIVLAAPTVDERLIRRLVVHCRAERIKLSVVPPARGMFGTAVQLNHIADLPIVEYNTWDTSRSTMLLKRIVDLTLGSLAAVLLLPLFLLASLAILLESRGRVFFTQQRAGLDGVPFRMVKFRTMVANAEALLPEVVALDGLRDPMFKLVRDPRVTRVGRFLRRASIDELPQLWNVLKGEMSLVGPRPEQVDLVERYGEEHRFRLSVKPGMTGPMQVYGRGDLSFDERLAVEREYVENLSLGRDLRILALTIAPVLTGRGAF